MFIVFLDGGGRQSGTSTCMLSMASYLADVYQKKTVVFSIQTEWDCLEGYVLGKKKKQCRERLFAGIGLEGLRKLLKAGLEEKKSAENCAFSCDAMLDLLPGSYLEAGERFLQEYREILPRLVEYLREHYELIFCDAAGAPAELQKLLRCRADGSVVVLNQNLERLKKYFGQREKKGGPEYYVFGCYNHSSKYNLNNLRYILHELNQRNSASIPYCTEILDACSDGELLHAIARGSYEDASEPMQFFFEELQETAESFLRFMARRGVKL